MRILALTGKLAEEDVRRYASEADVDVDVLTLPVQVASFITPDYALGVLRKSRLMGYDMILMPGGVQGDVSQVEHSTGIPTFKGPVHAADIPLVLSHLGEIELSKTVPASELLKGVLEDRAMAELEEVDGSWRRILREEGGLVVGGDGYEVPVGPAFPMRVIAEIVNAPLLDLSSVERRARYFEAEGADIIDIGMLAGSPRPKEVPGIVEAVRRSTSLPISIDTLEPSEIEAAIDAGVDLVLSVDSGNMEAVASAVSDTPVVVLPSDIRCGKLPATAEERAMALEENIERATNLGLSKIIADPVFEPPLAPGMIESLKAYQLFRWMDEETPMLFGLGNATELIDIDSPGVNGILTAFACEVGANLLFIPEFSPKARGSVRETVRASQMMFLARRRRSTPKDLGINLLILKEKRWKEDPYSSDAEKVVEVVEAEGDEIFEEDKAGWFRISVDREEGMIAATHFPHGAEEPFLLIKGRRVREIYQTAIRRGLVSKLDHAAYLGKELEKAAVALRVGRAYVQDEKLFS